MPLAIAFFGKGSPISLKSHDDKKEYHFWVQTVAVSCALFGFYAIYQNKENNETPHFKTWHGTVGAVAVGGLILQFLVSIALYPSASLKWIAAKVPGGTRTVYRSHGVVACVFYITALGTALLGFHSTWWVSKVDMLWMWYLISSAVVLIGLRIIAQVAKFGGSR